jgi:hypothetical protein
MDEIAKTNSSLVPASDDGFEIAANEAAGDGLIEGDVIKYVDGAYRRGKDKAAMDPHEEFVAVGTKRAWTKWVEGTRERVIIQQPDVRYPDRDELDDLDKEKWPLGLAGTPTDPWVDARYVTLMNPKTARVDTFITRSMGGARGVIELSKAIARCRSAVPGAPPVVKLATAPWPTRYGLKSRPRFEVIRWVGGNVSGNAATVSTPQGPNLSPAGAAAKTIDAELDDEIPF